MTRDLFDPDLHGAAEAVLRHRIFFALRPAPIAAERIVRLAGRLRARHGLSGWPTPAGRLHISLNGLGGYAAPPRDLIAAAVRAIGGLDWPSFVVALDRCATWGRGGGRRALVLWADDGLIGVRRLHDAIHARLSAAGVVRGREPAFEPHLTVLRDRAVVPEGQVDAIAWRAHEIVLLDSVHGESRHNVLGLWPLRSAGRPEGRLNREPNRALIGE